MKQTKDWTWTRLKKEVDEAHRRFFEKRGIDPKGLEDKYFEFGKGVDFRRFKGERQLDHTSQSSEYQNDQPI